MGAVTIVRSNGESQSFDAVAEYTIGGSATATRHAIETGGSVSDHVQKQPGMFAFRGKISETPSARADTASGPDRTLRAWEFIEACVGELVSVVSARNGTFVNMTLTRWPLTVGVLKEFQFDIQLDEIRLAEAVLVQLPGIPGAKDVGEQATRDAAQVESALLIVDLAQATAIAGNTAATTPKTDEDTSTLLEISDALGLGI